MKGRECWLTSVDKWSKKYSISSSIKGMIVTMKLRGEIGITFSFGIGNDTCPNPVAFIAKGKEL
jgi:hypothetical protein